MYHKKMSINNVMKFYNLKLEAIEKNIGSMGLY